MARSGIKDGVMAWWDHQGWDHGSRGSLRCSITDGGRHCGVMERGVGRMGMGERWSETQRRESSGVTEDWGWWEDAGLDGL